MVCKYNRLKLIKLVLIFLGLSIEISLDFGQSRMCISLINSNQQDYFYTTAHWLRNSASHGWFHIVHTPALLKCHRTQPFRLSTQMLSAHWQLCGCQTLYLQATTPMPTRSFPTQVLASLAWFYQMIYLFWEFHIKRVT